MLRYEVSQHRISFDDNEDESVCCTCRHSSNDSANLHRVKFADHHPWDDQEAESARDDENEDARDGNPCVDRRNSLRVPDGFVIHVRAESNHCYATADSGNERQRPSTAPPEGNARNDREEEPQSAEHDGARVFVHLCARVLENLDRIESNCVNARELIHHEVNNENPEGLQTRWSQESLKDFFRR